MIQSPIDALIVAVLFLPFFVLGGGAPGYVARDQGSGKG